MNELGNGPWDKNYKPSGISRAEERAMEIYPVEICGYTVECRVGAKPEPQDWNEERRKCFQEGYETAEKDLALTWEDIQLLDHFVLELVREEKEGKDWGDGKEFYTEVLRRFKEAKK